VTGPSQIQVGMPFCEVGAITGETCGPIKGIDGEEMSSPKGGDDTTYFVLVQPLLDRWGLCILP
jgi:hypothetical protein